MARAIVRTLGQPASDTQEGLVIAGTQTFAGDKTINGYVSSYGNLIRTSTYSAKNNISSGSGTASGIVDFRMANVSTVDIGTLSPLGSGAADNFIMHLKILVARSTGSGAYVYDAYTAAFGPSNFIAPVVDQTKVINGTIAAPTMTWNGNILQITNNSTFSTMIVRAEWAVRSSSGTTFTVNPGLVL